LLLQGARFRWRLDVKALRAWRSSDTGSDVLEPAAVRIERAIRAALLPSRRNACFVGA
jgi:hypothetical protein